MVPFSHNNIADLIHICRGIMNTFYPYTILISKNDIMDVFNPFTIELSVTTPTREVTPGDGNQTAEDLTQFPVVITNPPSPILVPLYILN